MIGPGFVRRRPTRRRGDVARCRAELGGERTAEKNRVEKLLEDAGIKLSVVASDIFGKSGRDMLDALAAGERSPQVLAQLARRSMRGKTAALEEAFTGHFTAHHGLLLAKMLGRIDALNAHIADLEVKTEEMIRPFSAVV